MKKSTTRNCPYPALVYRGSGFSRWTRARQRSAGNMKGIILRAVTVLLGTMGYVVIGFALASVS